jgi:hypothetical protein
VKIPGNDDSPKNMEETRQYIRDFIRLNDATKAARELYDQMLELYPDRANPGSLWSSAAAAKAETWRCLRAPQRQRVRCCCETFI